MKILDSDILVGILRKNSDAIRKYEEIQKNETVLTTVLNAQELLFGALISEKSEENFKACKELLNELNILLYDQKSMIESVKIQAYLEKTGNHIGLIDEIVAGICTANKATIITRNVEHFSRVPNLEVEKW